MLTNVTALVKENKPKQIVFTDQAAANAILYVVPPGRTFRGVVLTKTSIPYININDVLISLSGITQLEVTWIEGTVIKSFDSQDYYTVIGVES